MKINATMPSVTVIVAIYNQFNWLRLILDALCRQTYNEFEVVIADDGSNEATVEAIEAYRVSHPEIRIVHSWQPDEGWRKNRSLNNAVRVSTGDYLIFIDGDCVPHPRFVEDHLRLCRKGRVIGGRRVDMPQTVSDCVEKWEVLPDRYFSRVRNEILKSVLRVPFGEFLAGLRRTIRFPYISGKPLMLRHVGFWGCNFSLFRSDLEKVNGFDERYVDPGTGEDIDLGVRLENAGIRYAKTSHYALMFHRHHARLDFSSPNNARLYKEACESGVTYVECGINRRTCGD